MKTIVKGKNYDVHELDRAYAERKLARLERYLDDRSDAIVELSVEQHRSSTDAHIVEVTLVIDGKTLRGSAAAETHRAGIDEVVDKLERRAVDFREKPRARSRSAERSVESETVPAEIGQGRVVKFKRFGIEPMFEEDAVARMEELGHAFFVFVNAENERVAILYRRDDGDYGLIEPAIGGAYSSRAGAPETASGTGTASGRGTARR